MIRLTKIVIMVFFSVACTAADDEREHANKMASISSDQFLAVYEKYAQQIRAQATLEACGLSGLAKSIKVNTEDVSDTLVSTYFQLPKDQKLDCVSKSSCSRDLVALIAINGSMRTAYLLGYMEAMRIVVKTEPEICKSFTKIANDILEKQTTN